jgi:hypothetical protein
MAGGDEAAGDTAHCVKSPDQRHYKLLLSLKKVPAISFGGRKKSAILSDDGKSNCQHFSTTAAIFV